MPTPVVPPAALMQDCKETDVPLATNGDMVMKIRSLRLDLKVCNEDKRALRSWSAEVSK